jgi:gliding motility-associated-like protein
MLPAKKTCIVYLLLFCTYTAMADHITGGEIYYSYTGGASSAEYHYSITLKLFMICNTTRQFNNPTYVSFFDKGTNTRIQDISVPLAKQETISLTPNGPCIANPPTVCYRVGYYYFDIILPASANGYILASQVIYRVNGMKNLVSGYDRVGATYTAEIPGTSDVANAPENNSAIITGSDLVVICANNSFSYSFAASDADGDKLSYSFCNAYRESSGGFGENANPPASPPYTSVPYGQGYSGSLPLGSNVRIDPNTGLLSGIAPAEGTYVITVCVQEIRNNKVIATQRKDIQVTITACSLAVATLQSVYNVCGDNKTVNVANLSTSPLIKTFNWRFTNAAGTTVFASNEQFVSYTFPDTGIYNIQLVINAGDECGDTATAIAKVYPGFVPYFDFDGACMTRPVQFTDRTTSVYGKVNYWNWDFGDNNNPVDTSDLQDPSYTYSTTGTKNARLIVGDSKGCMDTIFNTVDIFDKPPLMLAFRDTLICRNDSVKLNASGDGAYTWSPDTFMINASTASPEVSPTTTTIYYVDLDKDGCLNHDSVTVNVVDHVTLQPVIDTTICSGDAIQFNIISDGLKYIWAPASHLNDATNKDPVAITNTTTTYEVTAITGGCNTKENFTVFTVPYPVAIAGSDTTICSQTYAQLHGITDASSFTWAPQTFLLHANTLNPLAYPNATTSYIFSAFDTKGCPKPGIDTITVTVLPQIKAYAGRDTAVVTGQSLQLNATGGTTYQWFPATGLSSTNIANPIALYTLPSEGIHYKVLAYNEAGCVDSASLTIKVFKTLPSVFVPTAFTPNSDGKNDILKPIAAGMERIEFFNVYNRWGQLVFSTSVNGEGWDGTINGQQQNPGVYVWMVKAIDYTGAPYLEKGTVTLIR